MNRSTSRGTWALSLAFLTNGLMSGAWISRLPAVRDRLGVPDATLGLVLLGGAIGALVSFYAASRVSARFGVRRVYTIAATSWGLLFGVAVLVQGAASLFGVLLVIGLANGVFGVVANAAGHAVELRTGRPILPRIHGMFSVGSLTGSAIGARVAGHVDARVHIVAVALVAALLGFVAARSIPTEGVLRAATGPVTRVRRTARQRIGALREPATLAVVGIGAIAMCSTLAEGASNNWSAIFLHDQRGMSEGLAAAGFAVYAGSMAVGRFAGNRLAARWRRDQLLRAEGVLLAVSVLLLVTTHSPVAAMVAMVGWGLGVAVVFPSAMGAAAEVLPEPTVGISRASTVAFIGFVVGPPTIGALASAFGLGHALLVLVGVGSALCALAPLARPGVEPAPTIEEPALAGAAA